MENQANGGYHSQREGLWMFLLLSLLNNDVGSKKIICMYHGFLEIKNLIPISEESFNLNFQSSVTASVNGNFNPANRNSSLTRLLLEFCYPVLEFK